MKPQYYLGVMSGTSLDGVDSALMDFSGAGPKLIATNFTPMPPPMRADLTALVQGATTLRELGEIDHRIAELYAAAINGFLAELRLKPDDIVAVGCHGQTVWHAPQSQFPFTMQIGDMNIVAARTGIDVIGDFRRKDMAFGGQGAPLVPAFHQALWARPDMATVVLNIGGIGNISVLIPDQPVIGYDTGPGNALMDGWIARHQRKDYDENGEWAETGTVHPDLLAVLLQEPYFQRPAPKSTGRELFNLTWLDKILQKPTALFAEINAQDVQATLLEFTARSVADELNKIRTQLPRRLLVCGGGAKNPPLMRRLTALLPRWHVQTSGEQGMDGDFVEAAAFAWLAYRRVNGLPSNMPSVTGAGRAVSLGAIFPAR